MSLMKKEELIASSKKNLISFYNRIPVVPVRGKDHWVWDIDGRKYLDFAAGIAVTSFGHANARINRAVAEQMKRITHISNLYYIAPQAELAGKIAAKAFDGKCFFCNSGAEANEAALKISRLRGNAIREGKNRIIAMKNSFHGRSVATITMTGQEKYRKGFEPLLTRADFVELNDIAGLEAAWGDDVCAFFAEPFQAEGGIYALASEFVAKIGELARKFDSLVVFDEVQTGIGRTGRCFGYQNFDIVPDIISMAKALGNGFPIGAVLVRRDVADAMPAGMHASTFGGNFAACAAANVVMDMLSEDLLRHIRETSAYLAAELEVLRGGSFETAIRDIRAFGLLVGIDLDATCPAGEVISRLQEKGVLVLRAGSNVLRLVPPFTIGRKEVDLFVRLFAETLEELKK
jgi:predicted acetylornithine/succinylornithine family transaminase